MDSFFNASGSGHGLVSSQPHALSARTQVLAQRVADAKGQSLSCCETLIKYFLGSLVAVPTLGIGCLTTVPANTNVAVFRFGKLDGVLTEPGVHCVVPCFEREAYFAGTQTHIIEKLNVIDAAGNPIIVSALLEYCIDDPAALRIATKGNMRVLFNMAEQVVRMACTRLPLLGEHGHDIRSQTADIGKAMVSELQTDATVFGVTVQRMVIVEARYAPEIAAQMLMKQQAVAMIAARECIVAGALSIVKGVVREFPDMSAEAKERLTSNMLVSLTSHTQAVPTIQL